MRLKSIELMFRKQNTDQKLSNKITKDQCTEQLKAAYGLDCCGY